MKNLITILTLFFLVGLSNTALATGEDGKKTVTTEEDKSKKAAEEKPEPDDVVEYIAPKKSTIDSSFQSISKYNFLFYMVYKVKYMDAESNGTTKVTPAE